MIRLLTSDDIAETLSKIRQRGLPFILSKLNLNSLGRTLSTFDDPDAECSNFWQIPAVTERWNEKITGRRELPYEDYVAAKYFSGRTDARLLSLGSGQCAHELRFARQGCFAEVACVEIAHTLLREAEAQSRELGLSNMRFDRSDINRIDLPPNRYDAVLFDSSLHHFRNVDDLLGRKVAETLKPGGLLILNEYVGPDRMQFPAEQIREINRALGLLPESRRVRFRSRRTKRRVSGPGWLRMWLSDPSEGVDSAAILPSVRHHFDPVEEHALGGNLILLLFKDIAHHFLGNDPETRRLLEAVFLMENEFILNHGSDCIFGIYRNKRPGL